MIRPETGAPGREESTLVARPMGIDTYQEPVVYMRADCPSADQKGLKRTRGSA